MRHYTTPRRREKAPSLNKINSSVRPPLAAAAAASAAAMKALHSPAKEEENESAVTQPRRCKKGNSTNMDSIPDDLLLQILARVPAEDLHENARFVCWRWYRTIHGDAFAYSHLRHARPRILFVDSERSPPLFLSAAPGGGFQYSISTYEVGYPAFASCNGLILGKKNEAYYILNPITNCGLNLPLLSGFEKGPVNLGLAYAAASMEYKVVATYVPSFFAKEAEKCAILTVGVDSAWRDVAIDQLSPRGKELLGRGPFTTEGFLHWVSSKEKEIVNLNVETEIFTEHLAPPRDYVVGKRCSGRHLTTLVRRGDWLWEVWEVRVESGEWRKLKNEIDFGVHKGRVERLISESLMPLGWVKDPDLFVFSCGPCSEYCVIYNLDTHGIDIIELDYFCCSYHCVVHRNSLVCLT